MGFDKTFHTWRKDGWEMWKTNSGWEYNRIELVGKTAGLQKTQKTWRDVEALCFPKARQLQVGDDVVYTPVDKWQDGTLVAKQTGGRGQITSFVEFGGELAACAGFGLMVPVRALTLMGEH